MFLIEISSAQHKHTKIIYAEKFVNMNMYNQASFISQIQLSKPPLIFSVHGLNGNEWYRRKLHSIKDSVQVNKLSEDNVLELKLQYGKLLVISQFDTDFNYINNIVCINFIRKAKLRMIDTKYLIQFIRIIEPECVVFEGTFEGAIIDFIETNSNFKFIAYKEFKGIK